MQRGFMGMLVCLFMAGSISKADDWPQWLGPKRDGVWREEGIVTKFPEGGPKVLWRTPLGGGFSGPAVADGKVYITDRILPDGVTNPSNPFARDAVKGTERVLCLDNKTGKEIWKEEYPCTYTISYPGGPRATPVVSDGMVYTLGAMGDLICFDAANGKRIWSKNFPEDYGARVPLWGFAAHPLVDGNNLICLVGGKGSVAVAFDKKTGKEVWKSLDIENSELGYAPPRIFEAGGKRQLIIWHPESVNGLDPETGEPYWSESFNVKANLTIPTPRFSEDNELFLTTFYNGSMVVKLDKNQPKAEVLWKGKGRGEGPSQTADLHAIMCTPFVEDGYAYGIGSYGELRCVDVTTGERKWMSLKVTGSKQDREDRWANAFLVKNKDHYYMLNEVGEVIIARMSPEGYTELGRAKVMDATYPLGRGRKVLWSHPAFADRSMYARNDKEIIRVSLSSD